MFPIVWFAGWILVPVAGVSLASWGFYCLLRLIPRTQEKNPNVRTDFFVLRASYGSIIVGLVCIAVWLLAAIVVDSMAVLKGVQALR
jgi:hypothetical protein